MTDEELYYKVFPGGCWHKHKICPSWRHYCTGKTIFCTPPIKNPDFSTWEGFGVLWEGMKEHRSWLKFIDHYGIWEQEDSSVGLGRVEDIDAYLIHPVRFRDACKEFFKEEETK